MGSEFFVALGEGGVEERSEEGVFLSKEGGGTKDDAGGMPVIVRAKAAFFLGGKLLRVKTDVHNPPSRCE